MTVKAEQDAYTLVVGLGRTGLSVVSYLRRLGEPVVVVDSRDVPPGLSSLQDDVVCHTGGFDTRLFVNARRIVVSPGVSLAEPALVEARRHNIEISGDIDLFAHEVNAPVIGITGSNGKSTVTRLLTAMAVRAGVNAVACGNIGTPVLEALDDEVALYVMELSSFQLETLQRLPMQAAVVLNISADHLDRYASLADYAMSKQRIYEQARCQVINRDDARVSAMAQAAPSAIGFTLGQPRAGEFGLRQAEGKDWLSLGEEKLLAADALRLRGRHNLQNALAALALAQTAGLPLPACLDALKDFEGLPHRTQFVASIDGVDWINDSKATNAGATIAALEGLPGRKILIAGGQAKGAEFSGLGQVVGEHCRHVLLMGQDSELLAAAMPAAVALHTVADMSEAVRLARTLAQPGDTVLLAPACASFDMFDNFEQRGKAFIQAVEQLQQEGGA